jgi:predicted GH43/DUF377 family glycosyl hydrolase
MTFENIKNGTEVEDTYNYEADSSFAKTVLEDGGDIHPLIIPSNLTNGTGLMNPSILNIDGKLVINIRHVNYTFYHSERKLFQHPWGPLTYLHPENDMHLRTENYYCELNDSFEISRFNKIDTSKFDTYDPMWDFVGLEDARLIHWNGKIFTSGVRRDTTTNGQGRMELCEIEVRDDSVVEVSRWRIHPPNNKDSYCEKNWMPVLDQPYTYVKWCNPVEVVKVDESPLDDKVFESNWVDSKTAHLGKHLNFSHKDPRGGSQLVPFGDNYLALTHEVDLFKSEVGRKDGVYRHRFVVFDKDWNILKSSKDFSLMNGHTEFACGMCKYNDKILITFGFQDNAAYILEVNPKSIEDLLR